MTLVVMPAALVVAGCSTYSAQSPLIRQALEAQDYEKAIKLTDKISQSNSELLYCLELATIQHEKGDYAQSNATFQRAEQVIDELYTKSISREVGAVLVNENMSQYRGDAFEAVLVNYYRILNYLFLEQTADALVECRKLNQKLQLIHDAGETYFVDDPFLQYLTALVYERGAEIQTAEVSYRRACELYDSDSTLVCPPSLHCDAAANALRVGDRAQAAEYGKRAQCPEAVPGQGRVLVLVELGAVAHKEEASITLPIFNTDRFSNQQAYTYQLAQRAGQQYDPRIVKYWLHIALPVVQEDPPLHTRAVVRATAMTGTTAEPRVDKPREVNAVYVEDLDYQANRAYKEKQGSVFLRAIARALAKYLASDAASKQDTGLGSLVNLLGVVTERADTRSWTTLPRSIQAARLDLDPGKYKIDVDLIDARGGLLVHQSFDAVDVTADGLEVRRVRLR
jgi:hypothetical protein